jgi:GST-like protein
MLDFYWAPTTNGIKILLFLEEAGITHRLIPVNIVAGDQFKPEFLKLSPNNKIPVIVDNEPRGSTRPVVLFESGAILLYLAEKAGQFLPTELHARVEVLKWLFWQVSGLGPMSGQLVHFLDYPYQGEQVPYAIRRYSNEVGRLYAVLNRQLAQREYIADQYSIADIACFGYVVYYTRVRQDLAEFPHIAAWLQQMLARPAVTRTLAQVPSLQSFQIPEESWKTLFGQTKADVQP